MMGRIIRLLLNNAAAKFALPNVAQYAGKSGFHFDL